MSPVTPPLRLFTEPRPACRSCGQADLQPILSLGQTPLANALLDAAALHQEEPRLPLDLVFCPHCALAQLLQTVEPQQLFSDYPYLSSVSDTMVEHARALVQDLIAARGLTSRHLVVEAASNDGYLLRHYLDAGVPVLGIEPAANVANVARARHGVPTRTTFFTEQLAKELVAEGLRADVFHAHNVLAHVPDFNGFLAGIRRLLSPDGVAVIEAPYLEDLLAHCEFDTIYHEHLCYFSLTALVRGLARQGLVVHDAVRVPIHGGSLRIHACREDAGRSPSAAVTALLQREREWGVEDVATYLAFAQRVRRLKVDLRALLHDLKKQGLRIAAYGASAKGSTLLNFCEIGAETIDFVVDRSPLKQGRFTPGTHLPIHSPARLVEDRPDYVLLLTWNFAEEILQQQEEYRRLGGRFILPVPEPRVA